MERAYEALKGLESGARAEAREHRALLKKAHALTPATMTPAAPDGRADDGFASVAAADDDDATPSANHLLFARADDNDDGPHRLAVQLGDHVDALRANLRQTAGLAPRLARGRAALQAVLLRHLDRAQYERVLLG
ncbi:hypothetical protein CDD83_5083 [Cordyceps sp. RAO-2017]|nr:hypothetical protein CDD83_5083 [Cordyceps sp. RAO-2017]